MCADPSILSDVAGDVGITQPRVFEGKSAVSIAGPAQEGSGEVQELGIGSHPTAQVFFLFPAT